MARSSSWLSFAPSLSWRSFSHSGLSLSLSLSLLFIPLLLPPLNPPSPARLDADLGREFAHVLGQGREAREQSTHSKIRIENQTPSGGSERRKAEKGERKPACSSSFDSAGRRGLPSEIFFFFFKERDFFFFPSLFARSSSRSSATADASLEPKGKARDGGAGEEEGEEKVKKKKKSLLGEPSALATKNWGLGSDRRDPGQACLFRAKQQGSGASPDPARSPRLGNRLPGAAFWKHQTPGQSPKRLCLLISRLALFKSGLPLPQRHFPLFTLRCFRCDPPTAFFLSLFSPLQTMRCC